MWSKTRRRILAILYSGLRPSGRTDEFQNLVSHHLERGRALEMKNFFEGCGIEAGAAAKDRYKSPDFDERRS